MRFVLSLPLALFLAACGNSGGEGPCNPNGIGHVTTEQRWTTDAELKQTTKSYRQTNLNDPKNFYGHRYFLIKDGRQASDDFNGNTQPKDIGGFTIDWSAKKMLTNENGKTESLDIKGDSKLTDVNLKLGQNISKFDLDIPKAELDKIKRKSPGASANGLRICSIEEMKIWLATSEESPSDLVMITYLKLNVFAAGK